MIKYVFPLLNKIPAPLKFYIDSYKYLIEKNKYNTWTFKINFDDLK